MNFVGRRADNRTAWNTGVGAGLGGVNILERQWIYVGVGAIRITPDAEIIILRQPAQLIGHISARSISAVHVIARLAQQRHRIKIRPAFAHAAGLQGADAHAAAHAPVAQAVGVFVQDHLGVQVTVAVGRWAIKKIHLHPSRRTIRWRGEIGIVEAAAILRVGLHCVVAVAAAAKVVDLKISRRLGETQLVKLVVHEIVPVKQLHHGGVGVGARRLGQIQRKIKYAERRSLRARQVGDVVRIPVGVRVHVVAERFVDAVVDPAGGRSVGVQRRQGDQHAVGEWRLRGHRR